MRRSIFAGAILVCLFYGAGIYAAQIDAIPEKYHVLYGNISVKGTDLTRNDTQYTVFMRVQELGNQIADSFKMGNMGDQYRLLIPMSRFSRGIGSAQTGDTGYIYIDTDDNPSNGNEIPVNEAFLEPGNQPVEIPYIIGNPGDYQMLNLHLTVPKLKAAYYDILNANLILEFNSWVLPDPICFEDMGMEVSDSGRWDFQLSGDRDLHAKETKPSRVINMDLNRAHPITVELALAGLARNLKVDMLLGERAFMTAYGREILGTKIVPVTGPDNLTIQMMGDGYVLGVVGDVNGNGVVTAYDAVLILKSTVDDPASIFPAYNAASKASEWLASYGYDCDVMLGMADVSGNGEISAFDAALALRKAVNLPVLAPPLTFIHRDCALKARESSDPEILDVSVDLNGVDDVYSADIVMNYDPEALAVAEVSPGDSVSGWLFDQAILNPGNLRISLAGVSQPVSDGPLVNVSFHVLDGSQDFRRLKITRLELNGGNEVDRQGCLSSRESLPRDFTLLQNYPNPFNPETWIPYQLAETSDVTITIYDLSGKVIKQLELGTSPPGYYVDVSRAAYWDGRNEMGEEVASGVYFYQLRAGEKISVRKMTVSK